MEMTATSLAGRRVAVTGATGFIGRAVTRAMRDAGAEIRAPVRRPRDAAALTAQGMAAMAVLRSDAPGGYAGAFEGCDTLIHLAYDMRAGAAPNLALFEAVVAAATAAGIARIVFLSSVAVYDGWPGDGLLTEASPCSGPAASAYVLAKRDMEQRLAAGPLPEAVILQPTIVYGPESPLWTLAPLAAMAAGGVVLPDPPGLCPAVHVEDVARAVTQAVLLPAEKCERFLINGDDPELTWADFYAAWRGIAGTGEVVLRDAAQLRDEVGWPAPASAAPPGAAARLGGLARRMLGHGTVDRLGAVVRGAAKSQGPALPGPSALSMLVARPQIPCDAARSRLGYAPKVSFAEGVARIAAGRAR